MLKKLLAYQELDAKLYEIEVKLSSSEERKKAVSAKKYIDGAPDSVNKLDDGSATAIGAYEQAVKEYQKLNEQLEELTKALAEAEDENAVEYLIKKADALIGAIKNATATIEKISEEMQGVIKEYAGIKKTTRAAQEQYSKYGSLYSELKKSVQDQRTKIEAELEKIANQIDSTLMERYKKKRANKIFPILYEVRGNVCGACNMELSMLELNKLKNGEIIDCDQCGRLIYSNPNK
ncbi:MAG: hypothetical protein IKZ38_03845 [Clostridia bacterium]|nr:hypothetical protein [Clostridia bacterium]